MPDHEPMKAMTVMKGEFLKAVPWAVVEPFERRAKINHGQTLARLNERGGLCPTEMYALLADKQLSDVNHSKASQRAAELWILNKIAEVMIE